MSEPVTQPVVEIAGRLVGDGQPCFVIAEAGVNHNGDVRLAHALVDVAADAGVGAVKFQTFSAERLVAREAPKAEYQRRSGAADEGQFEMLKALELPLAAHRELLDHCRERGLLFLSTPFDEEAADALETLGMPAYKIPSGELTNAPFLIHLAQKGRPLILSTGMATLEEVGDAVAVLRGAGHDALVVLHCVTSYPAAADDCNLRAMRSLAAAFGTPVGWSDHTAGVHLTLAAVALGACVIEKHFTLDRALPGPDHQASLTPDELHTLVTQVRDVERALGDGVKRPAAAELANVAVARKSLYWRRSLGASATIAPGDVIALRPAVGLPPRVRDRLVGRAVARDVVAGALVRDVDLEPER